MKLDEKKPSISPGLLSGVLLVVGVFIFISLYFNFPYPNGPDINEDGISDNFQIIYPEEDIIKKDDHWVVETVGYTSEADVPYLLFVGSIFFLIIPFGPAFWLWDRPRRQLNVKRWMEQGRMHDAVRRIAAFLEINPSLPSAVRLTRASMSKESQSILGELVWSPFSEGRSFSSVYSSFAEDWRSRSPLLGTALTGLFSAEKENDQTEVILSARAVVDRLSEGSKALMERYSRSLAGPSTALFGIGVLLPILLATMIPITGLTGRTAILLGFILWIILPSGIMLIGARLVIKRPSLGTPDDALNRFGFTPRSSDIVLLAIGVPLLGTGLFLAFNGDIVDLQVDRGSMIILSGFVGLSLVTAGIIRACTRGSESNFKGWKRIRSRSPPILREISSSIQEGHSFEHSMKCSSKEIENSMLPGAELASSGIQEPLLSYLESSREFSKAGRKAGGKAIRAYSKHIQEMIDLERDLSSRVRTAIGQMEITSSIFAPLMIGTSAGIFSLIGSMDDEVSSGILMGNGSLNLMEQWHFLLLTGGYLFALSIVTTLTIYRLENGTTKGGWNRVPRRLVQSSLAFCLGVVGSSLIIG